MSRLFLTIHATWIWDENPIDQLFALTVIRYDVEGSTKNLFAQAKNKPNKLIWKLIKPIYQNSSLTERFTISPPVQGLNQTFFDFG